MYLLPHILYIAMYAVVDVVRAENNHNQVMVLMLYATSLASWKYTVYLKKKEQSYKAALQ